MYRKVWEVFSRIKGTEIMAVQAFGIFCVTIVVEPLLFNGILRQTVQCLLRGGGFRAELLISSESIPTVYPVNLDRGLLTERRCTLRVNTHRGS